MPRTVTRRDLDFEPRAVPSPNTRSLAGQAYDGTAHADRLSCAEVASFWGVVMRLRVCGVGKLTRMRRPPWGLAWAVMVAWWAVAIAWTMDRPRLGRPAFSGQLIWCYLMLRAAGSGTRCGLLAESGSRVPNEAESDYSGAQCTGQYLSLPFCASGKRYGGRARLSATH